MINENSKFDLINRKCHDRAIRFFRDTFCFIFRNFTSIISFDQKDAKQEFVLNCSDKFQFENFV